MLKGFSMRFVRDRRMIRFGQRWNTTHVVSEVPAAHHDADENGMTALHWEAKKDCPDVVKSLVDTGADIEAKDGMGRSPLLVACENGNIAKVKVLVKAGASVRDTDNEKQTCLTLAAHHGHTKTVRYLVGLPEVDVNHANNQYYTALHSAAIYGHSDVVKVLIDAGADIEAEDRLDWTPLFYACYEGNFSVVKLLVKAGAEVCDTDKDNLRGSCLARASYFGHANIVRYLVGLTEVDVNHVGDGDDESVTALHNAVNGGYFDAVKVLIGAGADIEARNKWGRTPLLTASHTGTLAIMKMLVKAGASVRAADKEKETCLTLAAESGETETVRYLVNLKDVDVNHADHDDDTALHSALHNRHVDVVQVLIDAGADVEIKNNMGCSPLHLASAGGKVAIVKILVEAGASVCIADKKGKMCLNLAASAYSGQPEIVRYLAGLKDVDVNHTDKEKNTALHSAVNKGHVDVVQVLIDAGADIEAKDRWGCSPLLVASKKGNIVMVHMLVKAGAKVCVADNEGNTCLTIAEKNGHTETVRYLVGLLELEVKQTDRLGNTALEAMREEMKALQEMMKSVMDQQKEMLEAQKGVLGALNSL